MQHSQTFQFPKPTSLSSITPNLEVLKVLKDFKDGESNDEGEEEEPTGSGDPKAKVTEEVAAIVSKFKPIEGEDTDENDDDSTEDNEFEEPEEKPAKSAKPPKPLTERKPNTEEDGGEAGAGIEGLADIDFASVANFLSEKGLIVDIPEGFPVDEVNPSNFFELINHSLTKKASEKYDEGFTAARESIASALSVPVLDLVNFQLENANVTEEEVKAYMQGILYQEEIALLDPTDPIDAETIIRQYLQGSGDYTAEEIDGEVADLKETKKLESRATTYKPKLEYRVEQIKNSQIQERKRIADYEQRVHAEFMTALGQVLSKGVVGDVKLGKQEAEKVYSIFATDKVPVQVRGGKRVEMGYINHLIHNNMYGKERNLENLILATIILEGGKEQLRKYFAEPVRKEEITKFRSQGAASGGTNPTFKSGGKSQQSKPVTLEEKRKQFFQRKLV